MSCCGDPGPWGPIERRVLAAERARNAIEQDLRAINTRLLAAGQSLWDAWGEVRVPEQQSTPVMTCTATYSGYLYACSAGVVGQTVTIKSMSGSTLGTATTTTGGYFSGSVTIDSPSQSVDVLTSVSGYSSTSNAFTFNCGSNSLGTITLGSGGVHSVNICSGLCVVANLPFTDSIVGSGTLVWQISGTFANQWTACLSYAYPGYGAGGCAAVSAVVFYRLNAAGQLFVEWEASAFTSCPLANTCAAVVTNANVIKTPTLTSSNCSSYPATATFTMASSTAEIDLRAGAASQTITVSLPTH